MLLDLPNEVLSLIASYSPQALYPCSRHLSTIALPHRFCTFQIYLTRKHVDDIMAMLSYYNQCRQEHSNLNSTIDQDDIVAQWGPPEVARAWQIMRNYQRIHFIFDAIKDISVYGVMLAHYGATSPMPHSHGMICDLENLLDICYHLRDDPLPSYLAPGPNSKRASLKTRSDAARSLYAAHSLGLLLDRNRSVKCKAFCEFTEISICRHIMAFLGRCTNLQCAQFVRCVNADWLVNAVVSLRDFRALYIYDSCVGRPHVSEPFTPIGWDATLKPRTILIRNRQPALSIAADFLSYILRNAQFTQYLEFQSMLDFPTNFQYPPQLRLPLIKELRITEEGYNDTTEQAITYPQVFDAPNMYRFEGCYDLFSRLVPSQFVQITDLSLNNWVPARELHTIISKCTAARYIGCRVLIQDIGLTANHLQLLFAALPKTIEHFDCQPPCDGTYEPTATFSNTLDWIPPKIQLPNLHALWLNAFYLEDIAYAEQWEDDAKEELGKVLVWLKGEFPQLETFCNVSIMAKVS